MQRRTPFTPPILLACLLAAAWACIDVAPASAARQKCGSVSIEGSVHRVERRAGRVSCRRARAVVRYTLTHGKATMGCPGKAPRGWQCSWTYGYTNGNFGRIGVEVRRGARRVIGYPRGSRPA